MSFEMRFLAQEATALEANPPEWPPSVQIFGPEDAPAAARFLKATAERLVPVSTGKFSSERVAVLLKPGSYDIEVPVGYYTQAGRLVSRPIAFGEVLGLASTGARMNASQRGNAVVYQFEPI